MPLESSNLSACTSIMKDIDFTELINNCSLTEIELASSISVSLPTIRRWKEGKNLPHNLVREAISKFLKGSIAEID